MSGFEPREGISNPPTQTESRSKPSMFAGDKSLCQTVSLSLWLHSGHRKMWTSESPPELDTIAIRSISAYSGNQAKAVESATTTCSNFDMIPPVRKLYVNINA